MSKFLGIALVVFALAIGIVPHYTDCLSQGKTVALANGSSQPMKCHWSAQAEIGVAIPLGLVGLMMIPSRKKETTRNLAVMGIALGAVAMLIPTKFIGVCGMPTHVCVSTMKPALLSLGGVAIVGSAFGLVMSMRNRGKEL